MNNLFIIYYLLFISNSTQSNLKMSEQNVQEIVCDDGSSAKRFKQDSFVVSDPEMVTCRKDQHNIVHHYTVSCDKCLNQEYPKYYGGDVTKCNN